MSKCKGGDNGINKYESDRLVLKQNAQYKVLQTSSDEYNYIGSVLYDVLFKCSPTYEIITGHNIYVDYVLRWHLAKVAMNKYTVT